MSTCALRRNDQVFEPGPVAQESLGGNLVEGQGARRENADEWPEHLADLVSLPIGVVQRLVRSMKWWSHEDDATYLRKQRWPGVQRIGDHWTTRAVGDDINRGGVVADGGEGLGDEAGGRATAGPSDAGFRVAGAVDVGGCVAKRTAPIPTKRDDLINALPNAPKKGAIDVVKFIVTVILDGAARVSADGKVVDVDHRARWHPVERIRPWRPVEREDLPTKAVMQRRAEKSRNQDQLSPFRHRAPLVTNLNVEGTRPRGGKTMSVETRDEPGNWRKGFVHLIGEKSYKEVTFLDCDGIGVFEGDIVLGSTLQLQLDPTLRPPIEPLVGQELRGLGILGGNFRWPDKLIPFKLDGSLANEQVILDAIDHWEAKTEIRFTKKMAAHQNWVNFRDAGGCWSSVGMQGSRQDVSIDAAASVGNAIHEIGHVVGLWHEQSRADRDAFIALRSENIDPQYMNNFTQHITDGIALDGYDYASIMHYPRNAFSRNGFDTIVPKQEVVIGQRAGLSAGDIAAVSKLYR